MSIQPPTRQQAKSEDRKAWSSLFRPTMGDLIALGYMEGARPMSFGSTISGLDSTDGNVAFREGVPLFYPADLAGETVYLVSTAAGDTQVWSVQGLDANNDFQTQEVTATGTTPAAVPGTWNHVQRVVATTTANVGTVYCSIDALALPTTLSDKIQVAVGVGDAYGINPELRMGNNQYGLINRFDFSTATRDSCVIRIKANRQGSWILNFKFYAYEAEYHQRFDTPLRLYPGDSLRVEIELASGTNAAATFGMNGNVFELSETTPYAGASQLWSNV